MKQESARVPAAHEKSDPALINNASFSRSAYDKRMNSEQDPYGAVQGHHVLNDAGMGAEELPREMSTTEVIQYIKDTNIVQE